MSFIIPCGLKKLPLSERYYDKRSEASFFISFSINCSLLLLFFWLFGRPPGFPYRFSPLVISDRHNAELTGEFAPIIGA
jgi:hypothetical protein